MHPPKFILLEGPDGAGKSSLAQQLSRRYGIPVHHEGPPPQNIVLYYHILGTIEHYRKSGVVFDRLALSESIYGPLLRGTDRLGNRYQRVIAQHLAEFYTTTILCLPSYETCLASWQGRDGELFRDPKLLLKVWDQHYDSRSQFDFVYDWTKGEAFGAVVQLLDSHYKALESKA